MVFDFFSINNLTRTRLNHILKILENNCDNMKKEIYL